MSTEPTTAPKLKPAGGSPATRAVFETLLVEIVSGKHAAGSRLPSERDLATTLGASRPTVREALRRLSEWGLVVARRGSGIAVQAKSNWSLEVMPAYLRYGKPEPGEPGIAQLVRDVLSMRKNLIAEVSRLLGPRLTPEAIDRARTQLELAWEARGTADFVPRDFEIYRVLTLGAGMYPALWLLNTVGRVHSDIASRVSGAFGPPENYLESYHRYFGALQRCDGDAAARITVEYFDSHDAVLLGTIGQAP